MGFDNAVKPIQIKPGESSKDVLGDDFNGPTTDRRCRDVLFLLLFVAFMAGMGVISWRAVTIGNPYRLLYGTDSYGNICNRKNGIVDRVAEDLTGLDLSSKPYLFYFNENIFENLADSTTGEVHSLKICVSACPTIDINTVADMQTLSSVNGTSLCVYNIEPAAYFDGTSGQVGCPPLPVHAHDNFLYRCVPSSISNRIDHILSAINSVLNSIEDNLFEKGANDIKNTWFEMCVLCGFAVVISLVLTLLLQFLAAFIVWFMVVAMALGTLVATGLCWYHYDELRTDVDAISTQDKTSQMKKKVQDWLIGSICVTVITVVVFLVLLAVRKHIKLVVELFRQAGKAIRCMPLLLLQPLITVVFLAGTFISLAWVFLYIETAGSLELQESDGTVNFTPDKTLKVFKWYHLFGMLWLIQVILACHKLTIAGAVSIWYFTRDKSTLSFPILKSMWNTVRYHFGSIALGSLVLTLVMFVRMLLSFVENRLRGKDHPIAAFLLKCFKCCLWCFEKFIKFLNNNAYIEIAIYGYGFCKAARKAFHVIISNAIRLAAINSVGDFVLFLGKVSTVVIVTVVGIELLSMRKAIHFVWLPVSITGIFAYLIASCFMSVYEMTIDTIFVCFCEDCDMNDGETKQYYMSLGLRECLSANLRSNRPNSVHAKEN